MLHRLIASDHVETHEATDFHKGQDAVTHELIDVPGATLEVPRDFHLISLLGGRVI